MGSALALPVFFADFIKSLICFLWKIKGTMLKKCEICGKNISKNGIIFENHIDKRHIRVYNKDTA